MWVNFVNKAVMQPIKLPTRKLAQNMPKKSRIACIFKNLTTLFAQGLNLNEMPGVVFTACQCCAAAAHILFEVFQCLLRVE